MSSSAAFASAPSVGLSASSAPMSEFKAMIATPTLVTGGIGATTPTFVNLQSRPQVFQQPKYTFADLKAIVLDPKGEWKPIKFFDPDIKKTMLLGMDMPIKYVVTTDSGSKELKNFPVEVAPACYMNNTIGRVQSKEDGNEEKKVQKKDEKKTYRPPNMSLSFNEDKHKTFLEDITRYETMINKFLEDNKDTIRKQRDALRQQINLLNKSTMTKVDPNDKRDIRLVSIVKTTEMISNQTNQPVTYRNLDIEVADDDYRDYYMKQNDIKDDNPNARNFRSTIDFHLFEPGAYENGTLKLDTAPDGTILNGRKMSLKEIVTEKVAKVLALPTISFGALRFNITDKNFGVRVRKFLRYCAFVKQRPKEERVRAFSAGGATFTSRQFGQPASYAAAAESRPPIDEPASKRQKTEGDTAPPISVVQVISPPATNDEPPQADDGGAPQAMDGVDGVNATDEDGVNML